ncbi:hypothetical protein INR75_02890 [Zunongwangia sp. SCSIO 43204]|uniref:hypothetical protein n=1 Tax=Zunongwangia sp. SCSIO 43204 TaxID=2779359 RepID=UPI001CA8C958|nr:hypothetical protein [Zunongwangia sp. SCSIO 43204]UAB84993.1 hypothetical protein INR75_02890 [Zunongwangia sp. SCSIO 43204]
MNKTLKLTVHAKAFEVMVTGEKTEEYRRKSKWIMSRLWKKVDELRGIPVYAKKEYETIEIRNGYGKNSPFFIAEFKGHLENIHPFEETFSNGLQVNVYKHDQIIEIGRIIKVGNYGNIQQKTKTKKP